MRTQRFNTRRNFYIRPSCSRAVPFIDSPLTGAKTGQLVCSLTRTTRVLPTVGASKLRVIADSTGSQFYGISLNYNLLEKQFIRENSSGEIWKERASRYQSIVIPCSGGRIPCSDAEQGITSKNLKLLHKQMPNRPRKARKVGDLKNFLLFSLLSGNRRKVWRRWRKL